MALKRVKVRDSYSVNVRGHRHGGGSILDLTEEEVAQFSHVIEDVPEGTEKPADTASHRAILETGSPLKLPLKGGKGKAK